MFPSRQNLIFTAICLLLALIGGVIARILGLPLPFLLGGVALVGGVMVFMPARLPDGRFIEPLRRGFIAIIGGLLGANISPDTIAVLPGLWPSLLGLSAFVIIAHLLSYLLYRRVGRFDHITAIFAAMPGGLVEAATAGEAAGGRVPVITIQHFVRVILVIFLVPIGLSIWSGEMLGSASGLGFAAQDTGLDHIPILLLCAAVGLYLGKLMRVPAGHFLTPLILAAILNAFEIYPFSAPPWTLEMAQIIVGAGLGAQFIGLKRQDLLQALLLGILVVAVTLALTVAFAAGFARFGGFEAAAYIAAFAPGGIAEMGLIALGLNIAPSIVVVHHIWRIFLAVFLARFLLHMLKKQKRPTNGRAS